MALPALLGGLARGAAGAGGRGLLSGGARGLVKGGAGSIVKSGVSSVTKGRKDKGGALVKPKQSMVDPGGAIVPMKKSDGGGTGGGASFSSPGPKSEKSTAIVKSNLSSTSSALDILKSVKDTADQILEVEVRDLGTDEEELKVKKDQLDDEKKALEASKRDAEEEKQEEKKQKPAKRKKSNPIVNAAKKTMGGLWDFLTGLLGDFIKFKILDWISDPKNREKITNIVKFIQSLPELWSQFKERFIDPWWNFLTTFVGGGFEIFKSFLTVFIDVLTLKFFTNPQEFLNNLLEIPKTLLRVVPEIINSLLNAVTGGTIKTIGELVDKLFHNPLGGIDFGGIANSLGSALGNVGNFFKFVGGGIANMVGAGANAIFGGPAKAATTPPTTGTSTSTSSGTGTSTSTSSGTGTSTSTSSGTGISTSTSSGTGISTSTSSGTGISTSTSSGTGGGGQGEIDVQGTGDGGSGILSFKKGGRTIGPKYKIYSGVRRTWGSSQEERRNISGGMHPMPDGTYPLLGFSEHGAWPGLPGIGHWSAFINPGGSIGARGGIMLHSDIGSDGTAGCIGVELGGVPGTQSEKQFLDLYKQINPKKIKVALSSSSGSSTNVAPVSATRTATNDNRNAAQISKSSPKSGSSGKSLTQVQRENQILEASGLGALKTPIVTSNSDSSSSVINETISGPSLGSTLPTSGKWSIFKTNL